MIEQTAAPTLRSVLSRTILKVWQHSLLHLSVLELACMLYLMNFNQIKELDFVNAHAQHRGHCAKVRFKLLPEKEFIILIYVSDGLTGKQRLPKLLCNQRMCFGHFTGMEYVDFFHIICFGRIFFAGTA